VSQNIPVHPAEQSHLPVVEWHLFENDKDDLEIFKKLG